ncbi:prosaposin [Linepithema humile]|uniref:prosaposin n=1 Tax=Linepithema humile TaxID=83485 RepID=UPI00351E4237
MKEILIALSAILAVSTASVIITAGSTDEPLLGANECTWGPSYWCENLKTAKGCSAVKHCIQRYWEQMEVPEDNDSVCGICKDMVKQARDQLESNQTQQDLRDVFEGSCKLIHVKPIVNECINIVDQFIPELVETLASQMNPSVVCSVAGLCNNAHIDKMLSQYETPEKRDETKILLKNDELEPDECTKCYTIAKYMENKLHHTTRDNMLRQFLNICGQFSSFSDACSAIIVTHFNDIYDHLQDNFNANNICHLSGQCSDKYHKHEDTDAVPKVEITPLSSVGMVDVTDDLPCKLCEQLVGHLRDLLVANTTEIEFQHVLLGLCKQTKSFADECKAIVDEYYPQIYEYLTKGLDSSLVCQLSGICPSPGKFNQGPIWPLLPEEAAKIGLNMVKSRQQLREAEVAIGKERPKSEAEEMQLPIERMMPSALLQGGGGVNGKVTCALCEYVLHYIQDSATNPATEERVKEALRTVCKKFSSFEGKCEEFVSTYGDAIVAIIVQEIDPSQVCPMIHACPSEAFLDMLKKIPKGFTIEEEVQDKPNCPLCLFAVTQVYDVIKNNKTEANIEAELDKLCNHLPKSLTDQCTDFVKAYSKELVEMLLADLTPQEVCTYLKLCDPSKDTGPKQNYISEKDGEILSNEIPKYPLHIFQPTSILDDGVCIICEFAMQYIDKAIGNKKTRDKIEKAVHGVCNHLPKTVSEECNHFVDEYADALISVLSEDVSPKEVCSMINLCKTSMVQIQESITECALCRAIISEIDKLSNSAVARDAKIEAIVGKVCKYLPVNKQDKCDRMIEIYGPSMINMQKSNVESEKMCNKMALCSPNDYFAMSFKSSRVMRSIPELKKCTWGKSFVCGNEEVAKLCNVTKQCEDYRKSGEVV